MKPIAALLAGILAVTAGGGQETSMTASELNAEAVKAYQGKDYGRFLAYEKRALDLDPTNERFIYNVACGEALLGNAREAVRLLGRLLADKLDFGAETDSDFEGIRGTPEWDAFKKQLAELRKPVVRSRAAFILPDPNLLATGIAVDPARGDVFIASVRERKIVRRKRDGTISDFIQQAQDGFLAGNSLAVDSARHLLYATTSAVPYMLGYQQQDFGRTGVFAFNLESGKLARKTMLPADGKRHLLNALVVHHNGTVYVSDTGASSIYLLQPGASELERFVPSGAFRAAQGLALSADEKTLFVADYATGLWAVDLSTKQQRHLDSPPGTWLQGLDGISRVPDGFIAVQIGPKPDRVVRIRVDRQQTRVNSVEILEMAHPDYEGPIQGAVRGGEFLYVANSQLDLGNGNTGSFAAERARPTVVLALPFTGERGSKSLGRGSAARR